MADRSPTRCLFGATEENDTGAGEAELRVEEEEWDPS